MRSIDKKIMRYQKAVTLRFIHSDKADLFLHVVPVSNYPEAFPCVLMEYLLKVLQTHT